MLIERYKRFRISNGENEKLRIAKELITELARLSKHEPFWSRVRELGLKPEHVKDVMLFLESRGEIEIRRSSDGKRLWVLTLRDIKRNPIKLDRWLALKRRPKR